MFRLQSSDLMLHSSFTFFLFLFLKTVDFARNFDYAQCDIESVIISALGACTYTEEITGSSTGEGCQGSNICLWSLC